MRSDARQEDLNRGRWPMAACVRCVACLGLLFLSSRAGLAQATGTNVIEVTDCRISAVSKATVAAECQGVLENVAVREGDRVRAEALLAQVRDLAARAAFTSAERQAQNDIDLRFARKMSELATVEYSKAMTLTREVPGSHSEIDLLKLRLAAERAVLQVEQAAEHLEMAALRRRETEIALAAFQIRAPFEGVILQVQKQAGEAVHPGEAVAVVANFDRMRVEGFLPAAVSWNLNPGDPVQVRITKSGAAFESQEIRGQVVFVDPVINELSQEVRIWAEVPNPDHRLKEGMAATMQIIPSSGRRKEGQNRSAATTGNSAASGNSKW